MPLQIVRNDITTMKVDAIVNAPDLNPNRTLIMGKICGVREEEIEAPLTRGIWYLDKLVNELSKGKAMEQILRKQRSDDE